MAKEDNKIYDWQECSDFDIEKTRELYREYVNPGQVDLIGSFGFGKTLMKSAEGVYIYTDDGRNILDFTGGIGVLNHGHNHPRILAARRAFMEEKRAEVHKNFLSKYIAGLSHNIGMLLPDGLEMSYFCNSGAEAVEGAVKLAYKYHGGARAHILHADISFHGKLLGAAGLTGSPELHFSFPTIPNRSAFRYNDIESIKKLVSKLRKEEGASDIYAIIIEPFNASSLRSCSGAFLRELRKICTKEDIALIFDEVYTGWAKTGKLFYFMHDNVIPDILCYAKSFGGGKASISGYTSKKEIFNRAYGTLNDATLHSTTYNGFGEECITAIEAINIILDDDYVDHAARIFERINSGLLKLQEKHPDFIKEVRGAGALNGLILSDEINVALKAAISFIPGSFFKGESFLAKLVTSSVISELYNSHNILTFFGSNVEVPLIISPSLIVTDEQIDYFLDSLDKTLSEGKLKLIMKFAKEKFMG